MPTETFKLKTHRRNAIEGSEKPSLPWGPASEKADEKYGTIPDRASGPWRRFPGPWSLLADVNQEKPAFALRQAQGYGAAFFASRRKMVEAGGIEPPSEMESHQHLRACPALIVSPVQLPEGGLLNRPASTPAFAQG